MEKSPLLWVFAIILALLLGLGGGYWYGNKIGHQKGLADAAVQDLQKAAEAANPFSQKSVNPLENVKTNPFESFKFNPFK